MNKKAIKELNIIMTMNLCETYSPLTGRGKVGELRSSKLNLLNLFTPNRVSPVPFTSQISINTKSDTETKENMKEIDISYSESDDDSENQINQDTKLVNFKEEFSSLLNNLQNAKTIINEEEKVTDFTTPSHETNPKDQSDSKKKVRLSLPVKKKLDELEEEAKALTNTIDISNFYEYTKSCMKLIIDLLPFKTTPKPQKVTLQNIDPKKKLAVFDLDETLVHCLVKDIDKCDNILKITMPSSNQIATIGVNIHPQWEDAIKRLSLTYNIVIYKASHKSYADAVLNFLDPNNIYFYNRLYRNNCIDIVYNNSHVYIKDMTIFEKYFSLKDVVIIDNSVMAFAFDLNNGVPILPYYDAKQDIELMFCVYYLESIAEFDDLRVQNKKYLRMEHYLQQAEEEIKIEIEERKERKRLSKLRKANSKRLEKENRKKKREDTDCAKDFQFDFQVLRTTFSHDTEG